MLTLKDHIAEKKRNFVMFFIIFMVATTVLLMGMAILVLVPKIDHTFDVMRDKADKLTVSIFAEKLEQYLADRELALTDIAATASVTKTALLANADSPDFLDFIEHVALLGENPEFTIIDAVGDILYSELNAENPSSAQVVSNAEALSKDAYFWVSPLLRDTPPKSQLIIAGSTPPQFELAVPIMYGSRAEGVLIARITADPKILFKNEERLDQDSAVAYEKNGLRIASKLNTQTLAHNETLTGKRYGIDFTYTSNQAPTLENKKNIISSFITTIVMGYIAILAVLFILGRKILIEPFRVLATSQQTIESAVEGISQIDTQGRYISVNQAYAGIAGYRPNELIGQEWVVTVFPDDLNMLNKAYQSMIIDGRVSAEARGVRKDGSMFYKRITMVSQYDDKGVFIGHHGFMQDISAQKFNDEELRKQRQDLQLIFDNVPVKIWYKDDKNCILRLNKQAAESMGGKVSDFEGKDSYDLFPEMAEKYHEDDLTVINSNTPLLNIVEEYTPLDGSRGWVSTDKIPYTDPVTKESFIFVCSQDITKLKQSEADKDILLEKLSHTNEELEQFTYIASHDLKAPLRGIEQLADWIRQDCEALLPEQSKNHLGLMVNRVARMGRLLEDLLVYSHVNRIDLSQQDVDLTVVISELADLHLDPFGFKHTLDVPLTPIRIARKPFEIIIRNLLDNAVKHHHEGKGNITITYTNSDSAHIFTVADDGPGIAPEHHDKAFNMFQTLQPRDKVEGSGMGLAIIKKILYRYNGSIVIESDGISHTTFKIIWPLNVDDDRASRQTT